MAHRAEALRSARSCAARLGRPATIEPCEPDDDLLPAAVELCITGSDPAVDDTDGGGTPDGEEVLALSDPLDPADDRPPSDTDGDGLHDLVERFLLLTDPLYADSDGDGLSDPEELGGGTDPLTADTDGDGAPDGAERLLLGTDPLLDDAAACDGVEHPMVLDPDMVGVADVDGDGDPDLVGGDNLAPTVRWWSNLGGGTFGAANSIGGTLVSRVRAADFDQDGDPDVAWCAPTSDQIGWFENLGGGAFGPSQLISTTQDSPTDPIAADVDGDGDLDLVVVSYLDDTVAWYAFNAGTFGPENAIDTAASGVNSVVAADLDGDGDPDPVWMGFSGCGWLNNTWSDLDQDGLTEATEICITTTDPLLADTDAGGTPDARELLDLSDPLFAADDVPHLTLALAGNTWTVGGALPGATVVVAAAPSRAPRSVPGCPGLAFDLDRPVQLARGPADASGNAALAGPLPPAGTTGWYQAIDRTGCRVSDPLWLTIP